MIQKEEIPNSRSKIAEIRRAYSVYGYIQVIDNGMIALVI